jgi:type II secretory pathway pseudopilin PulG
MKHITRSAFTLMELCVSLGVIGLIAAIAIPNTVGVVGDLKRKAVLKETIQTVQTAYLACVQDGSCTENSFEGLYKRLNATKVCGSGDTSCRTMTTFEAAGYDNHGFVLPTGVHVWGFKVNIVDPDDAFLVDYNGTSGPNIVGEDILYMMRCFDEEGQGRACGTTPTGRTFQHGEVDVLEAHAESFTLFHEIYGRKV